MKRSAGIVIADGDPTSHPVILAKSYNIPCIINVPELTIQENGFRYKGHFVPGGQTMSLDGASGKLYEGLVRLIETPKAELYDRVAAILTRDLPCEVHVNADNVDELALGLARGAQGLGLCRTEHLLLGDRHKLNALRTVLFAETSDRNKLEDFIGLQAEDLRQIYACADGHRVVVRLLDPPLNEFLPQTAADLDAFLSYAQMDTRHYQALEARLRANASHLGIRGIRLGLTRPEAYLAQVQAILDAASHSAGAPAAHILVPFISFTTEFSQVSQAIRQFAKETFPAVDVHVGAMIETPMSALESGHYATMADFLSYGLNDLTMATYALERVGSARMLQAYVAQHLIAKSPFEAITYPGMKALLTDSVQRAKAANPAVRIGVCSEQVRDPETLKFFGTLPLDYVSTTAPSVSTVLYHLARNRR